jgi:hypothetical protein
MTDFPSGLAGASHRRWVLRATLATALLVLLTGTLSLVQAGPHHRHHCPECQSHTCCPTPETTTVKKHCWAVECKKVCIPAIKHPCAPCDEPPACGRVRTVKVLKRVEYECQECGYKWNIVSGCAPAK